MDTVLGKPGTGGLVTVVDRKARLLLATKIGDKTAAAVQVALIRLLDELECRSLTTDNGKEFARHKEISAALGGLLCTLPIPTAPGSGVQTRIRTDSFANICPGGSISGVYETMMFCGL